jgi:hypothetical protein
MDKHSPGPEDRQSLKSISHWQHFPPVTIVRNLILILALYGGQRRRCVYRWDDVRKRVTPVAIL